ncbi:hypothetical protein CHS0354_012619 [Potamilus streckersoni]|uniref:Uncharacterized protein n=1 Tax=Potamilus streckersoni TaxID=2493646 RepID=A0AAE0SXP3_9BIVA|nr:hypothetical protein CHS0354_012619 [Potamilus streckersoni]
MLPWIVMITAQLVNNGDTQLWNERSKRTIYSGASLSRGPFRKDIKGQRDEEEADANKNDANYGHCSDDDDEDDGKRVNMRRKARKLTMKGRGRDSGDDTYEGRESSQRNRKYEMIE